MEEFDDNYIIPLLSLSTIFLCDTGEEAMVKQDNTDIDTCLHHAALLKMIRGRCREKNQLESKKCVDAPFVKEFKSLEGETQTDGGSGSCDLEGRTEGKVKIKTKP